MPFQYTLLLHISKCCLEKELTTIPAISLIWWIGLITRPLFHLSPATSTSPSSFLVLFISTSFPFLQFLTNLTSFFMFSGTFCTYEHVLLIATIQIGIIPQIACRLVAMGPSLLLGSFGSSLGCQLTLKSITGFS